MVKGNANFMSPEQARGQEVDAAAISSRWRTSSTTASRAICSTTATTISTCSTAPPTGSPPRIWVRIRRLPDPASSVLEKALAFEPAERFQSAVEFADALAAHVSGGKGATASMMQLLFGDELRRQTAGAASGTG